MPGRRCPRSPDPRFLGGCSSALNSLEVAATLALAESPPKPDTRRRVTLDHVERALQKKALLYDKGGDEHFNVISAFRGGPLGQ